MTVLSISLIFRSKALFLEPKVGPKWDPNRIFDAEALRKPFGGLLERSWGPLELKKLSLEASWSRLGALKIASRWPDTDRPEVGERLMEHLSLAMVPG